MKNTFGFSILELMMAVGISGMAAIGVMQMTEDQVKIQKRVRTEFDIDTLVNVVQKIIVNRASCSATFSGEAITMAAPGDTTPINQIRIPDPGGGNIVLIDTANPYGDLNIRAINFVYRGVSAGDVKGPGIPANAQKVIGDIEIQAEKVSVLTNPNNAVLTRRLPFPIELVIVGGNVINDGCSPSVKDVDEDVVAEFCRMVTNGNGPVPAPGGDCDTSLVGAVPENSATVDDPAPVGGGSSVTRALSFGTLFDQLGGDDTSNGGLIRDLTVANSGALFSDSGDTMGKFVQLSGGNVASISFEGTGASSLIINGTSFSGNQLINASFFDQPDNLALSSECTGVDRLGLPATGGRQCLRNTCVDSEYSSGIVNNLECHQFIESTPPVCYEGQGSITINGMGQLDFNC